jgi:hypothetical protein
LLLIKVVTAVHFNDQTLTGRAKVHNVAGHRVLGAQVHARKPVGA